MKDRHSELEGLLRTVPLFSSIGADHVTSLLELSREMRIGRGVTLFLQGQPAVNFYLVLEGWVKVFRTTPAGDEAILQVFTRGETFAEAAAFQDGRYPAGAGSVSEARLLAVPVAGFKRLLVENPQLTFAIISSLSRKLHMFVTEMEQIKAQRSPQRVAFFLSRLCAGNDGPQVIRLPYDKALIAGRLGMKPETLSRSFAKLKAIGVSVNTDSAVVEEPALLKRFAEGD